MKNVSVRIEEELLAELRKIAEREYRSVSKQIVIAIRAYVKTYHDNKK